MRKHFFTLILALFAGMGASWAQEYDFSAVCSTGQTLLYNIIDAETHNVSLVGYGEIPWMSEIELPETVEHDGAIYEVTEIGDRAFYECFGLRGSLSIPNSVTEIGQRAFQNCFFDGSLNIGNSVSLIGDYAFGSCFFTGPLNIPNSVTEIGQGAFANCYFDGSLNIGNSVISIGDGAFSNCSRFTGTLAIGNSVTSIGNNAFYGCSGFSGSLVIPNSVITIGNRAFYYCNGFDGSLIIGNSVISIGDLAFSDCSGFTGSLYIGNSVTTIGDFAFCNCRGFVGSLVIPNSVVTIGPGAFWLCRGFKGSLTIGNSVTVISDDSFRECGFRGALIIGKSVNEIRHSFNECTGFTSIISKNPTPPRGGSQLNHISATVSVYVPCGSSGAYSQSEEWNHFSHFFDFKPYDIVLFSSDETMGSVYFAQLPDCEAGVCKVKAAPMSGYKFDYWMENGAQVSSDAVYAFEATSDRTLTAYFSETLNVNSFAEPEVQLFPNPTNDVLNVVCDGMRHITIMNTLGQVVYDAEPVDVQSVQVSLSGFNAGLYIVCILTDSGIINRQVIKAEQ